MSVVTALSLLAVVPQAQAAAHRGDPLQNLQWGLAQIHGPEAWSKSTGRGVIVAVVDSGVDATHPDLQGHVLKGVDLVHPNGSDQMDLDGHGTGVAGIIGAIRDNGQGIAGVAPDVKILPVKTTEYNVVHDVPAAIIWAADHGAKVINISLGTVAGGELVYRADGYSDTYQAAIDHAWNRGAVIVAGAGNSSLPICTEPAARHHVLCVGAVDKRGMRVAYSSFDAAMTTDYLVAPGGSAVDASGVEELIWTTTIPGTGVQVERNFWGEAGGTSYAAPVVAGVAALLSARGLTNAQIMTQIEQTTTDLGTAGRDPIYGYGEVNAAAALANLK